MKKKRKPQVVAPPPGSIKPIKVRLDGRNVITLASDKALAFWRQRYPKLEIIS